MMGASLNHCKKIGAELDRRFLKERAANRIEKNLFKINPPVFVFSKKTLKNERFFGFIKRNKFFF